MLPGSLSNSMGMYGASAVRPPSTGIAAPATSVGGPNNPGAAFSGLSSLGGGANPQLGNLGNLGIAGFMQPSHAGVGQMAPSMHASGLPNQPPAGIHPQLWQSVLQHLGQTNFGQQPGRMQRPTAQPLPGNIDAHAWGGPIAGPGAMY